MINSESDFIQPQVIYMKTKDFDAILGISHDGQSLLALRADLAPGAVKTIQAEACQIIKEEAASLTDNNHKGKVWLNGKWSDFDFDFTVVFNEVLLRFDVDVVITDHPR
jgi:hypothetical protein